MRPTRVPKLRAKGAKRGLGRQERGDQLRAAQPVERSGVEGAPDEAAPEINTTAGRGNRGRGEWGKHTACSGGDAKGASRLDLGSDAVVRHYTGTVGVETGLCNIHYKQNLVWSVD